MEKVKFRAMQDGDKADYELLERHETEYAKGTADRLLGAGTERTGLCGRTGRRVH